VSREYKSIRALRNGEVLDLEGLRFRMDVDDKGNEKEILPGDLYIAERNTGPQLLTADRIVKEESICGGYVIPTTLNYPYDLPECVKVIEA
jgi:hypothetical protein